MIRVSTQPIVTERLVEIYGSIPDVTDESFIKAMDWLSQPQEFVTVIFYSVSQCQNPRAAAVLRDLLLHRSSAGSMTLAVLIGETCPWAYYAADGQEHLIAWPSQVVHVTPDVASLTRRCGNKPVSGAYNQIEAQRYDIVDKSVPVKDIHENLRDKLREIFGEQIDGEGNETERRPENE